MFVAPGTTPDVGHKLTRGIAEQLARNWWMLLLNGAVLIVAGSAERMLAHMPSR
jgi:hypothetical protein